MTDSAQQETPGGGIDPYGDGLFTSRQPFRVDGWLVEPRLNRISSNGESHHLEPKTMEVLLFLADHPGQVVGREELFDAVWGSTFVTDNTLSRTVSRLRRALGDDWQNPRYLETISKSGYRLIAPISRAADNGANGLERQSLPIASTRPKTRRPKPRTLGAILASSALGLAAAAYLATPDPPLPVGLNPTPVLTLVGRQQSPVLSPDGNQVAFAWAGEDQSDLDVYLQMLGEENPVRLTQSDADETSPAWSRDGRFIAFVAARDQSAGLYRIASIGGAAVKLGDCSPQARHLSWSPDGKAIVFSDLEKDGKTRLLKRLDLSSGSVERLTDPAGAASGDAYPVYSPDGRSLAFVRGTSLRRDDVLLLSLESMRTRTLTGDRSGDVRGHDWTPDGQALIFSSNRAGQFALWRLEIQGGRLTRLPINDQWVTQPSLAREGNRLIYRRFSDIVDIHSLDLDPNLQAQGERKPLVPSTRTEFLPALSRDGSKLAFVSNRSGEFEVWSSDLGSGSLIRHTRLKGPIPGGPAWSGDGSQLIFDSPASGNLDLYVVDADSRHPRQLTDDPSDELNARFSRDGDALYFASNRSGDWQIWRMDWPQGPARQLTFNGGFVAEEDFEGRFLVYAKPDATLWRQPREGGAEEQIGNLHPYDWGSWQLVPGGGVFVTRGPAAIRHFRFSDRKMTLVHLPQKMLPYIGRPFSLSQDMRLSLAEIRDSDDEVMMVEWR